jgi:hypothetical protein
MNNTNESPSVLRKEDSWMLHWLAFCNYPKVKKEMLASWDSFVRWAQHRLSGKQILPGLWSLVKIYLIFA